jgi:hypothetical protein
MKDCRNVIICCGAYNLEVYNMLLAMDLDANLVVWS